MATNRFEQLLQEQHQWPVSYCFKFVVPKASAQSLIEFLGGEELVTLKHSSGGKYMSATSYIKCQSPQEVMTIYREASEIQGVIAL